MAFTDLGSLGATGSTTANQTTLALTTTATAAVGELVVVVVAADNIANGGDDGAVSSVQNSGTANTWVKGKQVANAVAAQGGASCSLWYTVVTTEITSGATITATFGSATLVDASAMTARHFSSAVTPQVEGTPGTLLHDTAADPGSLNVTTANTACLRIRGIAAQVGNNTNLTPTTSWTAWANGNSATTGTTAEMCARAEHRIYTGTTESSNPTYVSCINASVYVAFREPVVTGTLAATEAQDYTSYNADLLVHADGSDASTTFTDSARGHTVAPTDAEIDTAQSKFGGSSGMFAADTSIIKPTPANDFDLGTGDFTVDMQFRFDSTSAAADWTLFTFDSGFHGDYTASDDKLSITSPGGVAQTSALSVDTWYHLAVVRSGNDLLHFLDGSLFDTVDVTGWNQDTATDYPRFGAEHAAAYDADTDAWEAAVVTAGGSVSSGRKDAVDALIVGLKADGVWSKLDRLWLFAAENSQSALIDLVALDTCTATNSPTFTADLGYACNAVANVVTGYVPSTNGVNMTANSTHISAWYSSLVQNANMSSGTAGGGSHTHIYARYLDDVCYARANNNTVAGFANATTASQHIIANRSGASATEAYRNGSSSTTGSTSSAGLDATALYAHSQATAAVSAGGSLNSTQATAFYNRLRTYMNDTDVP